MGPIEILFYTVVVIFAFIGMVRGSNRELGNSIIFMYVVAVLGFAEERGWSERAVQEIAAIFGADHGSYQRIGLCDDRAGLCTDHRRDLSGQDL